MTESFTYLAKAGMDVDCNGGLVGNVLGLIRDVPLEWADPLGDLVETYLKGKKGCPSGIGENCQTGSKMKNQMVYD